MGAPTPSKIVPVGNVLPLLVTKGREDEGINKEWWRKAGRVNLSPNSLD